MPCVISHISCVQTLVNANGKNRSNVFFFPKLPLSFTSTRPETCLDLRLKSGALVPTDSAIGFFFDATIRPNQKRHAMCAQIFPAHEALFAPDAVGLDDLLVLIRYEGKRQFELLRELI